MGAAAPILATISKVATVISAVNTVRSVVNPKKVKPSSNSAITNAQQTALQAQTVEDGFKHYIAKLKSTAPGQIERYAAKPGVKKNFASYYQRNA
jgi:hypothetical protein